MKQLGHDDPKVSLVIEAIDSLHRTLRRHDLLRAKPDVLHDFVALHAAVASLIDDPIIEDYWRAQQALLAHKWPALADSHKKK